MRVRILLGLFVSSLLVAAPSARADFVRALASRDGADVIAVGDGGQLLRSLDGGATWTASTLGDQALTGVAVRGFTILVAGDSGKVWRSTDSGGHWVLHLLPGAPSLRSLAWATPDTAVVVGAAGAIWLSADAGLSWHAQTSGTSERLDAVRFRGALEGWIAGDHGTALHTVNGGALWTSVATPTTQALHSVDFVAGTVWLVGDRGVALKSVTSGASWTALDLQLDAGSTVSVVRMAGGDSVYIAGGGGFVRRSADGGATWTFLRHTLQAPVSDLCFAGGRGFLASDHSRMVSTTTDAGDTWSTPTGALTFRSWNKNFFAFGTTRGATLTLNPLDQKTLYCVRGRALYRSRDDGASWSAVDSIPTGTKTNAFIISPKDTNLMLAAVGPPDRIVRSTDGGHVWTDVFVKDFGEFGVPLEMDPDRPDTVLFGPDGDVLYRSTDFGQTWAPYSSYSFRSPCDIVIVPNSDSSVVMVGDGITNSSSPAWILRSTDKGVNWQAVFAPTSSVGNGSEIPELAASRLRPSSVYATSWSTGTIRRSTDRGLTWATANGAVQSWGVDVAKDDPDLVVAGIFGTGMAYVSFDGGSSFAAAPGMGGANFSFYARDRACVFAEQSTGIYQLVVQDSIPPGPVPSVEVTSPNGGENWLAGSVEDVTWNAAGVALAHLEYRPSPADPWLPIATVAGYTGHYAWTVPGVPTTTAEVRVVDGWTGVPVDGSDAPFTITSTVAVGDDSPLAFALLPNLPNPFERSTAIRYAIPARAHVKLDVYDLQGHRVATLVDADQPPGTHTVRFGDPDAGARRLPAGVYFAHLEAGPFRATRKLLLAR